MTGSARNRRWNLLISTLYILSDIVLPIGSCSLKNGKFPTVGPEADHNVQAVTPQATLSYPSGGRLPLLSTRPVVTFPAKGRYHIILLDDRGSCV